MSEVKREQFVFAIEKAREDPSRFLELVQQHHVKDDSFDLDEFFQALPKEQHAEVWSTLLFLTQSAVETLSEMDEEDECEVDETVLAVLGRVVVCCQSALAQDHPVTPPQCKETLQQLHDLLLSPVVADLHNSISKLCEGCWSREGEEGAGELVPHTLLYLVARTLADGATLSDLHRVWLMRHGFTILDFEDTSADYLKCMLLSCTLQPLYLTSEEGRKIISFLFGMHPKFVEDLHQTIKNQIPHCPKCFLEAYGEIYFRAWRLASGSYLKQIEEHCLQDLMFCAVHAPRKGLHSLFHSLRKLLSYIHQQKNQKGVSEMILRLYNPFLWRALKVANPHVRANAASLLFDTFPLQEPNSTREEIDLSIQKQFDTMMELLGDPSVLVRVTGVAGVCRVLSNFWEMVPAAVIKSLLGCLIRDLAWDASDFSVRVAVLQGLCLVLENRLSHPLLRNLLPLLQNHLHDNSEKVRIAFMDLLLLVKGMRTIKFWHICPIEHLLAHMEVDSVHVVKRIVALLVDSFQPSHLPPAQQSWGSSRTLSSVLEELVATCRDEHQMRFSFQIERCIVLIRANPGAARRFYQLAVTHLTLSEVAKFILAIHSAIVQCVQSDSAGEDSVRRGEDSVRRRRGEEVAGGEEGEATPDSHSQDHLKEDVEASDDSSPTCDPIGISQGGWKEEGGVEDRSELSKEIETETEVLTLQDSELITGLLETMVVLWEGAREELDKRTNRTIHNKLVGRVAETLSLLFDTFKDGPSRSALYLLSCYLPKKSVACISRGTLQTLASLSHLAKPQDYSALLLALVSWQQTGHVIKLINQWLVQEFSSSHDTPGGGSGAVGKTSTHVKKNSTHVNKTKGKPGGKASNSVVDSSLSRQPMLALEILGWMMSHPVCFQEMKKVKDFWELKEMLKKSMELLESHLSPDTSPLSPPPPSFPFLTNALSVYVRMCMHKRGESGDEEEFGQQVQEVLTWAERVLIPALSATSHSHSSNSVRRSSRKRKAGGIHSPPSTDPTAENARSLVEMLLGVMAEVVLTGLADGTIELECAHFAGRVTETASAELLLPPLCKLLYQLCEASGKCEVEGIHTDSNLRPAATLLDSMLQLLQRVSESDQEKFEKLWLKVKPCVSMAVVMSVRMHSLSIACHSLAIYSTIVQHAVETQVNHIRKHPSLAAPTCPDDLPPFVGSVVAQSCKDAQSTNLFASHLHNYLSDCDFELPDILLTHQSSLQLISALVKSKHTGEELVRCVRISIQFMGSLAEEAKHRWNGPISEINSLVETVHEGLYYS